MESIVWEVKMKFKTGDKVWLIDTNIYGDVKEYIHKGVVTVNWKDHPFRATSFEFEESLESDKNRGKRMLTERIMSLAVVNPTLSMSEIAKHFGCSEYMVNKVYANHGAEIAKKIKELKE